MCIGNYKSCRNGWPESGSDRKLCFKPTNPLLFDPAVPCYESKKRYDKQNPAFVPDDWPHERYGLCDTMQEHWGDQEPISYKFYGTPQPTPRLTGQLCDDCDTEAKPAASKKNAGVKKEEDEDGDQKGGWGTATGQSGIALK